jgi:hypothetical protein
MTFDEWKRDATERISRSQPAFPETIEGLDWLVEHHPEEARRCLPPRSEMWYLGKPASFGRMKPFREFWRERVILTAVEDSDFAKALMVALRMRGAA